MAGHRAVVPLGDHGLDLDRAVDLAFARGERLAHLAVADGHLIARASPGECE
jgi:hypothetical protein